MAGLAVLTTSAGRCVVELDMGAKSDLLAAKRCVELVVEDMGAEASDAYRRRGMGELVLVAAARLAEVACL